MFRTRPALAALAFALLAAPALGQIPQLQSRPGAAYTLYLNFGSFEYTGTWDGKTPGARPAYDGYASNSANYNPAVVTPLEATNIRQVWSQTAQAYAAYNINVTTVDPAPAGSTDPQRQAYYQATAGLMHNHIGGTNEWYGGAGGVSYLSVAQYGGYSPTGQQHTNWTFGRAVGSGGVTNPQSPKSIAVISMHELGHALKLSHQGTGVGGADYDPGNTQRGPVMGTPYSPYRALWRNGTVSNTASVQNDAGRLLTNTGGAVITGNGVAGFMDSGNGHTRAAAAALPMAGTAVDSALAKGLITPNSTNPDPLGEANYTTDYFKVTLAQASAMNVVFRPGQSTITPGVADRGATLDGTLRLLDFAGDILAVSDTGVFSGSSSTTVNETETINQANLAPGVYYLQISSAGADARYFDMGSYFLTGSIVPVPEPGLVLLAAVAGLAGLRTWLKKNLATD